MEGNLHYISPLWLSLMWAKREAAVEVTGSVSSEEKSFPRRRLPPYLLSAATGGSLRISGLAQSGELTAASYPPLLGKVRSLGSEAEGHSLV